MSPKNVCVGGYLVPNGELPLHIMFYLYSSILLLLSSHYFLNRVFHKMFSQDFSHVNTNLPVSKTSPSAPPILKRTVSWRSSPMVHTGLRSGKANLEKMRRCKSLPETDDPYETSVTLESITELEHKTDNDNSRLSPHLLYQEVQNYLCFVTRLFATVSKVNCLCFGFALWCSVIG